jgi:hypothetical protein
MAIFSIHLDVDQLGIKYDDVILIINLDVPDLGKHVFFISLLDSNMKSLLQDQAC